MCPHSYSLLKKMDFYRPLIFYLGCFYVFLPHESSGTTLPKRGDFATTEMKKELQKKFLDLHNELRGRVSPGAADMNYLLWNDDLANLAQMWANQCVWDHGFLKFGLEYPKRVPFPDQLGQNLAREWGAPYTHISETELLDRVTRWFNESYRYTYSKYSIGMSGTWKCRPSGPCGHYTQLAWGKSKYVGCGLKHCPNSNFDGFPHPWIPGDTIVACDYAVSGNVLGQYPYKKGKPCSKCASQTGFCYNKLCRECENYDAECGTKLTQGMCSTNPTLMAKKCPKMCGLCECPLICQNGGKLNKQTCSCTCPQNWRGTDCSENASGPSPVIPTTIPLPAAAEPAPTLATTPTSVPAPPVATTLPAATAPPAITTPPTASVVPTAATVSPTGCQDKDVRCPFWASVGECKNNVLWMIEEKNCLLSCNQCGECRDIEMTKCTLWSAKKQCKENYEYMLTKCRKSCGLCIVNDSHRKCSLWTSLGECKTNTDWMIKHCADSCKDFYCHKKSNGNYPDPATSQHFIMCTDGSAIHMECPLGSIFNKDQKVCKPAPGELKGPAVKKWITV